MENQLDFTISTYIIILLASTGLAKTSNSSCNRTAFENLVRNNCTARYNESMASISYESRCPWPTTKVPYFRLSVCVEYVVNRTNCVEPSLKDAIFLEIHRTYFSLCGRRQDPKLPTLLLLILPCIITTFTLPFLCVHITTCDRFPSKRPSPRL
ncbi:hypothetical protein MATL_G00146260 [Megalops atlanticus]|uniref:Uncharacterized protein n=1 Tax=Megalops atlanticus TaxID=7932 RepID=A0A9D3PRW9_MEGAT|nr:hypothetical protein MATL_G00146260 [Megalops atlanticus]